METINKKDLIPIFKNSGLVDQFKDEIIVPKKYVFTNFKMRVVYDIVINDNNDFNKVMDQLRYFMFKELPHEIYEYVIKNKPELSNFKDFFFEELSLLKDTEKNKLINECASKGYLNLLKYLYENGYDRDEFTCSYAAENGNLDCLKYLHENGCDWSSSTCMSAAENGNFNCLKYLHENGCTWGSSTCEKAVRYNHFDCLKYAHENGCSWDEFTSYWAAINGNLDYLKYAHKNGCVWDSYTCNRAACYGNLDCLKYAIENNCPYNKQNCINMAKGNKHTHIVKYLKDL